MSCIFSIDCHVDDGAHLMTADVLDVQAVHQLVIAGCNLHTIHRSDDAVAADFLHIGHTAAVQLLAVCPLQALADWMRGSAFRKGSIFNQLCFINIAVVDSVDLENALSQGTCFIKHNAFGL